MTQVVTRVLHSILTCFINLKTQQYKTEINLNFKCVGVGHQGLYIQDKLYKPIKIHTWNK